MEEELAEKIREQANEAVARGWLSTHQRVVEVIKFMAGQANVPPPEIRA